jgi:anaerobic selenocysteine-containing dehydrogenase
LSEESLAHDPHFLRKGLWGNACPLTATIEDGRVTRVANNPAAAKYPKGCWRGFSLPLELSAHDRMRSPLIRDGERGSGRFRETSWDEALRFTAERLGDVRSKLGAQAVLDMGSGGSTSALHATGPLIARFLGFLGGATA